MKLTVKYVPQRRRRRTWNNRGWRYRGGAAVAAKLGVTWQHLYLVLEGRRTSPALLRAARQLLKLVNKPTKGEPAR